MNDETRRPEPTPSKGSKRSVVADGAWIGVGIALGVAFGAALDNLAMGIALGLAAGVAMGASSYARTRREE